jgi:cytosine/adenosine deaminase-related metal-dependent hydrolase
VIAAMTRNPADAYGLGTKGRVEPGADADLLLLDPGTGALSAVYGAGRPLLGPITNQRSDSNLRQGELR